MNKILALGDIHLGAGSIHGPGRLQDQEAVLDKIADLIEDEQPAVVLLGGDVWESRHPTPDELAVFGRFVRRLAAEPCDVLAIVGNHDVRSVHATTALELFADRIDVHREPALWYSGGLTVATLPWAPVSWLVAQRGSVDRSQLLQEAAGLLVDVARGLRADCGGDGPAVLLAHWSMSGASLPAGLPTDSLPEVVLPAFDIEAQGWDAVILSHIHKPQHPGSGHPSVLYTGSPLPLNFGEAKVRHGVWTVEFDGDDCTATFHPIASRAFVTLDLDAAEMLPELWGDLGGAIVRARYRGTREQLRNVDGRALLQALYHAGAWSAQVVPVPVEEIRARADVVDEGLDEAGALAAFCAANEIPVERAAAMHGLLAELQADAA